MKRFHFFSLVAWFVTGVIAPAQLAVSVAPVKITGQKAVVALEIKNNFDEKVESARAAVFLLDAQGKMIGNATRWVIGGQAEPAPNAGLAPGATNLFHFVITADKPFATTNLITKVSFSRVVLAGGKLADVTKDVRIEK